MSARKLTRSEIQQFTALGIRSQIDHHWQEITRLRAIERTMRAGRRIKRPPMDSLEDAAQVLARAMQSPPKKRTMSNAHRLAVSKAQKRRWRKAKAGKAAS